MECTWPGNACAFLRQQQQQQHGGLETKATYPSNFKWLMVVVRTMFPYSVFWWCGIVFCLRQGHYIRGCLNTMRLSVCCLWKRMNGERSPTRWWHVLRDLGVKSEDVIQVRVMYLYAAFHIQESILLSNYYLATVYF